MTAQQYKNNQINIIKGIIKLSPSKKKSTNNAFGSLKIKL